MFGTPCQSYLHEWCQAPTSCWRCQRTWNVSKPCDGMLLASNWAQATQSQRSMHDDERRLGTAEAVFLQVGKPTATGLVLCCTAEQYSIAERRVLRLHTPMVVMQPPLLTALGIVRIRNA
jgi:hypothetical protein